MKKIFSFLLMVGFSIISYAQSSSKQCITENLRIILGQTSTFTSPIAQCTNCYDWDINDVTTSSDNQTVGTVKIVGTDMEQTVQIQGVVVGPFRVTVTYFNETGCHTCYFEGNVVSATPPCDINFNTIEHQSENAPAYAVSFTTKPINTSIVFTYLWTFNYADGTTSTSTDEVPILLLPPTNKLLNTSVVITSSICTKTIFIDWTRAYDMAGLWGWCRDCDPPNNGLLKNQIIVFPNPTNSTIEFKGENLKDYTISIFNRHGNEIIKNSKIDRKLNIEKQEKGIYLYVITNKSGFKQEGKIIKE